MHDTQSILPETVVSKPEAVRRAIAALGYRAELPQILEYVQKHFSIDVERGEGPPLGSENSVVAAAEVAATEVRKGAGKKGKGKE